MQDAAPGRKRCDSDWEMADKPRDDIDDTMKPARAKDIGKEARLAEALRRNLLKRKEQTRARSADKGPDGKA